MSQLSEPLLTSLLADPVATRVQSRLYRDLYAKPSPVDLTDQAKGFVLDALRWPWDRYCAWVRPDQAKLPKQLEGKYLGFYQGQFIAHEPTYSIVSRRGGFNMGRIEWSPQWRAWMFRPHSEAVFPMSAVAEVYVFIRDLGGRQV